MNRELMSDLITEEIEAVMRERAERDGESTDRPWWRYAAFQRAFADPAIKREAVSRALSRHERMHAPPVPDQGELFEGEDA